jgi:hypothetical protein
VALALLCTASLCACGRDETRRRDAAAPPAQAEAPPAAARGEREVIAPEDEASQREQVLVPRDAPSAVGSKAPAFDGLPSASLRVIVFYRGEW